MTRKEETHLSVWVETKELLYIIKKVDGRNMRVIVDRALKEYAKNHNIEVD